ncbi:thiolase family protein [Intrasporangium sp.]|uniref:thiolase family protein n=1 Tax=Intrasporangium sp. TaxID=1925024 RepID=UPI003221452C
MSAVIVAARRTPIGTAGHGLAAVPAADLAAAVLGAVAGDVGRVPDEVLLGNCMGPGGNVTRVAALSAGLPDAVPALTVDRQCASGLAAIELGARLVQAGAGMVIAGGLESASSAPWRMWPPRDGAGPVRYERAPFAPEPRDVDMGRAADLLALERGVSRVRQDEYAAQSHERAVAARERGEFDEELVPVGGLGRDERPRAGLGVAQLSRFRPVFRDGGTVTVGNSCGINDGAAAVAMVPEECLATRGRGATGGSVVAGLRVLGAASVGVCPERPGIGIVPAVRAALTQAGLGLDEVDVIEFNEAFAGQVLACYDELGIDPARVCRDGGALALGHPWGASGAVLVVRLFTQLVRRGRGRVGLAAIAAGGGQGTALVVDTCR